MKDRLGADADPRIPWRLPDYSKRIQSSFGKLRGLWRCHWLMSECLEEASRGHHDRVGAWLAQGCKALHQALLASTAALLLPLQDPLASEERAGDPQELVAALGFQTAFSVVKKLRAPNKQLDPTAAESEEDNPLASAKAKALAKKKGKKGGRGAAADE